MHWQTTSERQTSCREINATLTHDSTLKEHSDIAGTSAIKEHEHDDKDVRILLKYKENNKKSI